MAADASSSVRPVAVTAWAPGGAFAVVLPQGIAAGASFTVDELRFTYMGTDDADIVVTVAAERTGDNLVTTPAGLPFLVTGTPAAHRVTHPDLLLLYASDSADTEVCVGGVVASMDLVPSWAPVSSLFVTFASLV
jgi:hypothetical protein